MGTYKNDSKNLADVIAALSEIPEILRIRLSSIELQTIGDPILAQMGDPKCKLVKYLHIPIQSGSDRILQLMRRRYTITEARNYLDRVAEEIPGIGLGTDLIVGFPGETEADFAASVDLVKNSPLHYAHIFSYSPREGTVAALLRSQFIDSREIERRSRLLREASREKRWRFFDQYLGVEQRVLFENENREGFPGYTENYIRIIVKNYAENLANMQKNVKLIRNCGDHVLGEIVA
jgi:threonylcarbamoyladenosine tRNA methylthiotransferase MtaB